LDQQAILQQFENLERKTEQLIETCKRREVQINELKQANDLLTSQLNEKLAAERQNEELKALVRSKIDSLMGRLSEFAGE
jgi:FtsZ-binding cell division protein ZapB